MDFGEEVWAIVAKWNSFQKDTIGKQLVRAADSIAANLREGFGHYHFRENINHVSYYSRGSQKHSAEASYQKINTTNSPWISSPSAPNPNDHK